MPTNPFKRVLSIVIVSIAIVATILSYFLYYQGPRVRLAQFDADITQTAFTRGSTLTLRFDRPVDQEDYTHLISFNPAVDFETTTATQGIIVRFSKSLNHDTEYTMVLAEGVHDQAGKPMAKPYTYTFHTAAASYAYLERDYGYDPATENDKDDHVLIGQLDGSEPEVLFAAPTIRSFTANAEYALIAVADEAKDRLVAIDLKSREITEPGIFITGRIGTLAVAPRADTALFTVIPDYETVSPQFYAEYAHSLLAYDISSNSVMSLTNSDESNIKATEVRMSADGQVALIRDETSGYYAVSPYNDYDPVLLGSYAESYGFNDTDSEVIFREGETIMSFDVQTSELIDRSIDTPSYIQSIDANRGPLYVATIAYTAGQSTSRLEIMSDWQETKSFVWQEDADQDVALTDFSPSYDSRLVAIQLNEDGCQYDNIGLSSQCRQVSTVIYDLSSQAKLMDLEGFDFVWLP